MVYNGNNVNVYRKNKKEDGISESKRLTYILLLKIINGRV